MSFRCRETYEHDDFDVVLAYVKLLHKVGALIGVRYEYRWVGYSSAVDGQIELQVYVEDGA